MNADKASLLKEIEFLQRAASNFDQGGESSLQLAQLESLILNRPRDDMNLQEQQSL